jgi:D-alanyl-D-alanine carboxypeptidase
MNRKYQMKSSIRANNKNIRRRRRLIGFFTGVILALSLFFIGQALLIKPAQPAIASNASAAAQPAKPSKSTASAVKGASTVLPQDTATKSPEGGDWRLILVNPKNRLAADFTVKLTKLSNSQSIDERCYPDLQKMMDDCRAAGLHPLICSSFRSYEKQQQLFDNKVKKLVAQGDSEETARKKAATVIAVPGTSEHQTGLALDIVDLSNQNLDESQAKTPVQQWLMKNCMNYGFILRYPEDKTDITNITYEPWHYRYVGKDAAKEICDKNICLEEYLGR